MGAGRCDGRPRRLYPCNEFGRRNVDGRAGSGSVLDCAWAMVAPGRPRATWSGSSASIRRGLDALVNALAAADTGQTLGPGVVVAFRDRVDAGQRLAERMRHLRGEDAVVLGLPRGGVVVAAEVARVLDAPLDVIVVRKLGVPFQPELAMGAVGESGAVVVNERVVRAAHVSEVVFADVEGRERAEVERRARRFREGRPPLAMADRTALVVDDGIATGSTARAACRVARAQGAARVVLAVPVCARDVGHALCAEVDEARVPGDAPVFSRRRTVQTDFRATSDEAVKGIAGAGRRSCPGVQGRRGSRRHCRTCRRGGRRGGRGDRGVGAPGWAPDRAGG